MKHTLTALTLSVLTLAGCNSPTKNNTAMEAKDTCTDNCCKPKNGIPQQLSCTLTTPELQKRKQTVLASLEKQVKEKKELTNGYAFKFEGTDKVIDELIEFVKTERECCNFFTFNISVAGDKSQTWLEITGPDGAKDFITTELGL